jgi:glycosyltransferase involved in cell wall biosynthesis
VAGGRRHGRAVAGQRHPPLPRGARGRGGRPGRRHAEEWSEQLDRLIADADLRRRLADNAREKAAREYSLEANGRRVAALLPPATPEKLEPRPRKKRILLQNIFFPPQTIGGSTRVLRDNVDSWLDSAAREEFDFAVVASDNGALVPNQVRVEEYRGCPVFRLGPPPAVNMEWRPFDPAMGKVFANILQSWRPDLVHFHAVQRLSGSIIEETLAAGSPTRSPCTTPGTCRTGTSWWTTRGGCARRASPSPSIRRRR